MPAATPNPSARTGTADAILNIAQALIQSRGYSAISYQDIASALNIRKASIHHHFPTKADLGAAVVERYIQRFEVALNAIMSAETTNSLAMLDFYFRPYREIAATPDQICLCGALAGEMPALPPTLRERVDYFFKSHHSWLAAILRRGSGRKEFVLVTSPERSARLIFDALQGALLVRRTTGETAEIEEVIAALLAQIGACLPQSQGESTLQR
ncbi:TetR/AcrR family transcriptional regulator [Bosea vaviloviae]|uniref:HTH tetR-type domain-containing protein n=1 Tax=Bosea vaviloviae TaxID=1526658 RepID=A0A0N0MAC2_9HYPH|nr:TetR/AcrR family transcriptional regulator [Bosea vaviloviae]KPH79491.1 hypothetical protein AE618_16385 [Bosea vaviloviae]